jgi:hypothetical protein
MSLESPAAATPDQQMLARLDRGDVGVIAAYSLSRISRSVADLVMTSLVDRWDAMTNDERKRMLASIFDRIVASAEGIVRMEPCEDWRPYLIAAIPRPVGLSAERKTGGQARGSDNNSARPRRSRVAPTGELGPSSMRGSGPLSGPPIHPDPATGGSRPTKRTAACGRWIETGTAIGASPCRSHWSRSRLSGPSPSPAPIAPLASPAMRRGFGLQVAAIAFLLIACTGGPSEIPSSPATASSSASPAPTVAVSSTPAPTASASSAAEPLPGVQTTPLGQVTGNWLFYGVRVPRPERNRIEVQIVAVPVGGGAAKTVVAFDAAIPANPNGISDTTPYLRRQFSPDGRRMVLSIDGQLVVIDLVTGRAKPLGVQGFYPSWSRDGSLIAFVFEKADPLMKPGHDDVVEAIGVVPAAGGSPRELTIVGYVRHSVEWSPDGSRIFFSHNYRLAGGSADATMEVASGRIGTPTGTGGTPSFAHWRAGSPELAIAGYARIVAIDEGAGSVKTLVDVAEPGKVYLRDPRWNPAVADELLYVAARYLGPDSSPGGLPGLSYSADGAEETHVLNIATGNDTRLPISAYEATWTWDGSAIAYLAKSPGSTFGSALRVWKRDGSGETELRRATGAEAFFSIASVNY